jgi:hypothetical protein
MKTEALKTVRRLYCVDGIPRNLQRHNCQQWVRSIRFLGDKWLLAKKVTRAE